MKKNETIKKTCVIALLIAFIAAGCYSLANIKKYYIERETKELEDLNIIYNNIYVRGRAVGGLTHEQADLLMDELINGEYVKDKVLRFHVPNGIYEKTFTYSELGMGFDTKKAVNEAYIIGRNNAGGINRADVAELDMGGKYLDAESSYSLESVENCLKTIEEVVNKELKPAGKTMDVERTAKAAEQMLIVNEYDALIFIATK